MSYFVWSEDGSFGKPDLRTCALVLGIIVLIWYIGHQQYIRACNQRIHDIYVATGGDEGAVLDALKKRTEGMEDGPREKHRISVKNPEKRFFDAHEAGDTGLNILRDHIKLDPLFIQQEETTDEMLMRSLVTADYDGQQMEGMTAPIDEFERSAMKMQLQYKPEIYGDLAEGSVTADTLSESNM